MADAPGDEPAADERPSLLVDGAASEVMASLDISDDAPAPAAQASSAAASGSVDVSLDDSGRERQQSVALNDDPIVNKITGAASFAELAEAVKPPSSWEYGAEQAAGIERAKTYVQGSDKDVLCGFFVSSINEGTHPRARATGARHRGVV